MVVLDVTTVVPPWQTEQGTVSVVNCVNVLQVEVTVVMPPTQVVQGTITVVTNGAVAVDVDADDVMTTMGVELGIVELEEDCAATGVLDEEVVRLIKGPVEDGEAAGTTVVTGVMVVVVFAVWLQLEVTTPFVVYVLQRVHGKVMRIVDMVVIVFTSVMVTLTARGVLVSVTTKPVLSVEVVVIGGGVELVTIAETGVISEDVAEDDNEEVLSIELEDDVKLIGITGSVLEAGLDGVELVLGAFEVKLMTGPLELAAALLLLHGAVTVVTLATALVTVTVAVGEHT